MPFNSFNFWLIFPFIFGIYWLIPVRFNQGRKVFLTVAGYLLYMNWKPAFALVLLGVTLIIFFGGICFDKDQNKKKILSWCLALFKEPMHLNDNGAREYTAEIIKRLKV